MTNVKFFLGGGSICVCEQFFSKMYIVKNPHKNRFDDGRLESCLRVANSEISPVLIFSSNFIYFCYFFNSDEKLVNKHKSKDDWNANKTIFVLSVSLTQDSVQKGHNSEMCHPRCVYKSIGRDIKSITQQVYLMTFIRGWYNYMFRPIPAITRFSSERVSMFTLFRIKTWWWLE